MTEVEESLVVEALRSGWVAPLGPFVDRFESEVAARVGVRSAVALSSGTAALHLALLHAGASPGRVVVLPSMTFAATANAVLYTGAEPVFVDSRRDDANVDPALLLETVARLLRDGRDVAAVVTVDLFGRAADHDVIDPGLADLGVPHVEDAAEALGAGLRGRAAGSFGQSAALSFNGNKIMTTSGGGMLLSDDPGLVERARYLATQARQPAPWYEHTEAGYNYRMSNLLAALGVGQLSRLDEMIARRRTIRDRYVEAFADLPGVSVLGRDAARSDDEDNCWLTCVVLDPEATRATADSVVAHLGAADVEARHLWKPMHLQPMYRDAQMADTGTCADLFARGVTLPSGSALADDDIERVVEVFTEALAG
ncbi:aminotransferase class I/II-fold pyridoxal phosphate-dependent enzyme [Arthrobacter sp. NEB 688]|uniref:aminotransferase class I/II-fold pyridoxal phosphate-dependent enzyme n=1 Tax=Arthrobacter sp. NEB 688 TaxID=904039 RepID=UPI00256FAE41|nr:aminotransferase class I/II-fold pyridoxal phosphate-dependent enzyme [Arthrobacter sp. NEB 688]